MIGIRQIHFATVLSLFAALYVMPAANAQAPVSPVSSAPIVGSGVYGYRHGYRSTRLSNRTRNTAVRSSAQKQTTAVRSRPGALKVALGKLNLSSAQKAQIADFQVKADADGQAAFSDRSLTAAQSVAKMNATNQTMIANIESTLTPSQRTKFVSLMPELH